MAILLAGFIILPAAGLAGREQLPNDVVWVKESTAYKCCVQQAYLNGMNPLKDLAKDKKPGTWRVVLDADETIISNVTSQMTGLSFSQKRWGEWCKKSAAPALPGAEEFCGLAQEMGGKVIIVTNRKGYLREATEKNLKDIDFPLYGSAWANPPMYTDPARFEGKKVRVTGKVGPYRDTVQLTIGGPEDIEIIE